MTAGINPLKSIPICGLSRSPRGRLPTRGTRLQTEMHPSDTFTLLDLGGVFVLNPRRSEIDAIADKIAVQWAEDGETLETMLKALREERDRRGS